MGIHHANVGDRHILCRSKLGRVGTFCRGHSNERDTRQMLESTSMTRLCCQSKRSHCLRRVADHVVGQWFGSGRWRCRVVSCCPLTSVTSLVSILDRGPCLSFSRPPFPAYRAHFSLGAEALLVKAGLCPVDFLIECEVKISHNAWRQDEM